VTVRRPRPLKSLLSWWIARLAGVPPALLRGHSPLRPDGPIRRCTIRGGPERVLLECRIKLLLAVARDAAGAAGFHFNRLSPIGSDAKIWSIDRICDDQARLAPYTSFGAVPKTLIESRSAALRNQHITSHADGTQCFDGCRHLGSRNRLVLGQRRSDREALRHVRHAEISRRDAAGVDGACRAPDAATRSLRPAQLQRRPTILRLNETPHHTAGSLIADSLPAANDSANHRIQSQFRSSPFRLSWSRCPQEAGGRQVGT